MRFLRKNRGIALILVLFVMLLVFGLVLAFLYIATGDLRIANDQMLDTICRYIAQAGIEDAIYELRRDDTWLLGFTNKEFPEGSGYTYTVVVQKEAARQWLISSTGAVLDYRKTISSRVRKLTVQGVAKMVVTSWEIK